MSHIELKWLHEKSKQMNSVLEIGSYKSRSTHALCTGCRGAVYAIDSFMCSIDDNMNVIMPNPNILYEEFMKNVGHFNNLKVLKMDSIQASKLFEPKSIDMIFIDGDHSKQGVINDINAWLPICKKLLCGHDLIWPTSGVEPALKELDINYTSAVDSIWTYEIN